jgi:malate dehydrogenase (oxaloacetate-decarboxylating)(NADP+)
MAPGTASLVAHIPPYFCQTDHRQRCLAQLRGKVTGLEKYIYLNGLKERDSTLFYELVLANMLEIIPILYTPTVRSTIFLEKMVSSRLLQVGDACSNYSHIWSHSEGLYISIEQKGHIRDVLRTWPAGELARIAVVTDG